MKRSEFLKWLDREIGGGEQAFADDLVRKMEEAGVAWDPEDLELPRRISWAISAPRSENESMWIAEGEWPDPEKSVLDLGCLTDFGKELVKAFVDAYNREREVEEGNSPVPGPDWVKAKAAMEGGEPVSAGLAESKECGWPPILSWEVGGLHTLRVNRHYRREVDRRWEAEPELRRSAEHNAALVEEKMAEIADLRQRINAALAEAKSTTPMRTIIIGILEGYLKRFGGKG